MHPEWENEGLTLTSLTLKLTRTVCAHKMFQFVLHFWGKFLGLNLEIEMSTATKVKNESVRRGKAIHANPTFYLMFKGILEVGANHKIL